MNTPSRKTATSYVCPISETEFIFDPGDKQSRTDACNEQLAHTASIMAEQSAIFGERNWSAAERRALWLGANR